MEKLTHIRQLLEKFYEGRSTLDEEDQLRDFFSQGQVPDDLLPEKEIFGGLTAAASDVEVPDGLGDRLKSAIEARENREVKVRRINWLSLSGLAAGLAIILAVYFTMSRNGSEQYADTGTYEDPQVAYEETLKVLSYVSGKWNAGTKELENLQQINRSIDAIRPIRKINTGTRQLQLLGNLEKVKEL